MVLFFKKEHFPCLRNRAAVRLTFARRLALIVWLSLMAVWLVSVALFTLPHNAEGGSARTLPAQVAALVMLLEPADAAQRQLILQAVHTEDFSARVEAGDIVGASAPGEVDRLGMRTVFKALAQLAPRAVSVRTRVEGRLWPRPPLRARTLCDIRVGLLGGGTLVVEARTTLITSLLGLPAGFGVGLLGVLVSIAALYFVHREIRPLARLAAAVDRIDPAGEMAALPADGHAAPEIQALVGAFARLQERLAQLLRARMAMMGGISHDVRTFATRLRLRVERIEDAAERGRAVADIEDMIALLDDALLTSRAGAGDLAEELVDMRDIAAAEVADRQAHGQTVDWAGAAPAQEAQVLANRVALRRIVSNLVENALKYGGAARLGLAGDSSHVTLTVDDDGPGIPAAQRAGLFEPFVRLEDSRSRRTGGAGLGLAVVRTLARALGGEVWIEDAPGGGARLVVRLARFR